MSESIVLRSAVPEDADCISEIYTESILAHDSTMDTEPFSGGEMKRLLDRLGERERVFVLETDAVVRGWGIVKKYSDRPGYRVACETSIYLRRDQRAKGYGSLLQEKLLEFCREVDYHHVVAKIWADNDESIEFHRKFGFTMVGVQNEIGHVAGTWRDVAVMQCLLDS